MAAIDDEIVALGLAGDRFVNGGLEQPVALGQAQRGAQIGGVLLTEAHIERASAGDADAIAALAEIVRQRRDEADPTPGLADRVVARRPTGAVVALLERPALLQLGADQRERQILLDPGLAADIAHRHDLDEDEVEAFLAAPGDQAIELVVIDALEGDRVDLDGEAGALGRRQTVLHHVEPAPSRDRGELRRIERVDRNVDTPHAAILEFVGKAGELAAIGRQGQLVERAALPMAAECPEQAHDVAPHQGLAAGQAQLAHTEAHEGGAQPVELLEAEDFRLRQKSHVFGHAIDAAEVAAVRHRDA